MDDWVTEKLKQAAGVVDRSNRSLAQSADDLIAREKKFEERKEKAFAPHHAALDARHKQMDQLEDSLHLLGNIDPLAATGDGSKQEEAPAEQPGEEFQNGKSDDGFTATHQ